MFSNTFVKVYKNGTYTVLFDGFGTKRYIGEEFIAETPDSLDIKLTEVCNRGCPFCHESSSPVGNHADMDLLCQKLAGLPEGVEIALGGGDVLLYPNLDDLLQRLKNHFHVALTIRLEDWLDEVTSNRLLELSQAGLVQAIGISIADIKLTDEMLEKMNPLNMRVYRYNTVYHVIPGITSIETLNQMLNHRFIFSKILILGYKSFGRGASKTIDPGVFEEWRKFLTKTRRVSSMVSSSVIAYDNLALEQLKIKDTVGRSFWESSYMGNEFTHSMYIDAVRGEFAPTSRSPRSERVSWENLSVIDYFKNNHD